MLAVGVVGGCLDIFLSPIPFLFSRLSPGDGSIKTEILPQRTDKPKTTKIRYSDPQTVLIKICMALILF